MQLNKLNNIIFLKEPDSNIIKEAFVILKDNVNIQETLIDDIDKFKLDKIDIQKEAEQIINSRIDEENLKYKNFKMNKLEKKIKKLKLINILLLIIFVFLKIF